ncbi:MAG: hypothetical protein B6D65_01495 [candidate division Zixibacteria bacterium 4484_93]|nr:MAG: hypothetical protein B6D65_01495 [candidate division Zixibacteria bacterium 4484_93]
MNSLKEKKSGIVSQNENIRRGSELCGCFATLPFGSYNSRHTATLRYARIACGNFVCSQNVKETGKEPPSLYLEINERRKKADKWETHRILVFDDVLLEFVQELKKAARFIADRALAN